MVTTAAAGADLIEAVPGDPARVREVAASWLETSHAVGEALDELEAVCKAFPSQQVHVAFSELRVGASHNGLIFTDYCNNYHEAAARSGRYDGLGA